MVFMPTAILWNSLVLKSTQFALFYIRPSVPVSLHLCQITFANHIDCKKKAEDKQNYWTTTFYTHIYVRNPKKYFRWVVNVLENDWGHTKRRILELSGKDGVTSLPCQYGSFLVGGKFIIFDFITPNQKLSVLLLTRKCSLLLFYITLKYDWMSFFFKYCWKFVKHL